MTSSGASASNPIVVGFDPQTLDRAPVRFAVAAARANGVPVLVAAVCLESAILDSLPAGYGDEEMAELSENAFAELEAELGDHGQTVEFREVHGSSPARALHELARREHARLVVVGSTLRSAIGRVLPGSTAERLLHGAPCPVAVVPHGWTESRQPPSVGVAFTHTGEGLAALRLAHRLCARIGAPLRVLSVVPERAAMYGEIESSGRVGHGRTLIDVEGQHRVALEAAVTESVGSLPGLASDVDVSVDSFVGDPAEVLVGVAENLDLLICGSRAYGPVLAVMLGGVSRRIVNGASCPVLVLPRGAEEAPA